MSLLLFYGHRCPNSVGPTVTVDFPTQLKNITSSQRCACFVHFSLYHFITFWNIIITTIIIVIIIFIVIVTNFEPTLSTFLIDGIAITMYGFKPPLIEKLASKSFMRTQCDNNSTKWTPNEHIHRRVIQLYESGKLWTVQLQYGVHRWIP